MGRNILSICDECEVYIFHLRGKESDLMQKFQNKHSDHEKSTRIVSDYVEEQPEHYEDVTDELTTSTPLPEQERLICTNKMCRTMTIRVEAEDRNFNTGNCALCDSPLEDYGGELPEQGGLNELSK